MLCKDLAGNRLCSVSKHRPLETRLSERYILELTVTGCPDKIRKLVFFNLSDKYILQFGQIHFVTWTNTLCNLDKYAWQFGQIQSTIRTNTFWRRLSERYILELTVTGWRRTKEEKYAVSLSILWHSSSPQSAAALHNSMQQGSLEKSNPVLQLQKFIQIHNFISVNWTYVINKFEAL